jgi:hypothetical protein
MLTLFAHNAELLGTHTQSDQFEGIVERTREQLNKAARLHLRGRRTRDALTLEVQVENLTGHKFPTGHPYRRTWLHVWVEDATGKILFESGGAEMPESPPHYNVISRPEEVQIYQAIMADDKGRPTWSLLRAASFARDNRIPPKGLPGTGSGKKVQAAQGVENDPNFGTEGSGTDQVTYEIPLPAGTRPFVAQVELLYQSIPPAVASRLREAKGPAAREFVRLYSRADKQPVLVDAVKKRF